MVNLNIKLPDNFFEAEVKNGFLVSKERKELWGVELDLLWQFKNICDKYHLKHYLDGGTLLGAVRHGGFIPWDDDIDIAMPRTDYDRFLECAVKELNYPYFVQNDWTDSTFYCCTKLRRSDTTCIHKKDLEGHFTFNQGIFIDICPFDNVPDDLVERQKFMHQLHLIKLEALAVKTRIQCYDSSKENTSRLLYLREKYQELRQRYNVLSTESFGNLTFPNKIQSLRNARDYNNKVYLKFEWGMFPAPEVYLSVLTNIYGNDFMMPMPGRSMHGELLVNTSIGYKDNYNQFMSL